MNYFFLPGNPPAVHFYEQWGREIIQTTPDARTRVSHYPNLKNFSDSKEAMNFIFERHLQELRKFVDETKSPVVMIGHSLGGYFALKLLESEPQLVEKAILIHPFLRNPTRAGRMILEAAGSVSNFNKFQKLILTSRKALEFFFDDLLFVTNEEILRSFHLARHEKFTIGRDRSPIVIPPSLREKVQVFYTARDTWCGPQTILELKEQVQVTECPEPHAFVTLERHRRKLFQRIVSSFG